MRLYQWGMTRWSITVLLKGLVGQWGEPGGRLLCYLSGAILALPIV